MNLKYSKILLYSVSLFLVFEGLDAFSINNIPVYWIGVASLVFVYLFCYLFGFRTFNINLFSLRNWVIYGIFITLFQSLFNDLVLPKYASTSYIQYISLRILRILLFLVIVYSLNYILKKYDYDEILKFFLISSILISFLSLISYFSYIYGYSDFPRTRQGSGGWTQPIQRACNILRNYGTFREPSFLAVWIVPTIPLYFYNAREKKYWYILSLLPITCLVLTRSLTGVMSFIIAALIVFMLSLFQKSKLNLRLLFPIFALGICLVLANLFAYKFPPLDENQCPPYTPDYCSCEYYDDEQDRAKNSTDITSSIFSRLFVVINSGISSFDSLNLVRENMYENNVSILGTGLGISNIKFSDNYAINKSQSNLQYSIRNGAIIERYENSIVSFNNLYLNILFSTGIFGFFWLLLLLIKTFKKLPVNGSGYNQYLNMSIFVILIMYLFQGEELSVWLATFVGLFISEKSNV